MNATENVAFIRYFWINFGKFGKTFEQVHKEKKRGQIFARLNPLPGNPLHCCASQKHLLKAVEGGDAGAYNGEFLAPPRCAVVLFDEHSILSCSTAGGYGLRGGRRCVKRNTRRNR